MKFILSFGVAAALGLLAADMTVAAVAESAAAPGAPAFVEDFESGRLDPARWREYVSGENSLAVQQEQAAHGRFALRVRCPAPASKTWAFIAASDLPASLRRHHFGRAYVYITPKPPARHTILLMAGTPGFPFNKFQEVATSNGRFQLTYVELKPEGNNEDYHSGGTIPVGRWFCLEWEFNDEPNRAAVWVDGQPVYETGFVSRVNGRSSNLVGAFTDFLFGFRLWGAAPEAFDVFYDDIALDPKRIGPISASPPPR
jgi:hypothetical protein